MENYQPFYYSTLQAIRDHVLFSDMASVLYMFFIHFLRFTTNVKIPTGSAKVGLFCSDLNKSVIFAPNMF